MHLLTPAKINLSLAVVGKRLDGYHLIDSLVGFLDFHDELDIQPANQSRLQVIGDVPTARPEDNLAFRALKLLQEHGIGHYAMTLTKRIYCGAGLGGGSANAAGVLRALGNTLPPTVIDRIALSLGADVPLCLTRKPIRAEGIGEKITPLDDFPVKYLVLVAPNAHLSTQAVFNAFSVSPLPKNRPSALPNDPTTWHNDLEAAAISLCPEITNILQTLHALPQKIFAGMSGSGVTCFAALPDTKSQQQTCAMLQQHLPNVRIRPARLLGKTDG